LQTGLGKWSPEVRGRAPPPSSVAPGQPGLLVLRDRLLHIPEVCQKKKVQLFSHAVKTVYLEVVKIPEWEMGLMG